ncbi:MAG: FAD-dependent oxidoreductase [Saprospiraceae bacterium]|nr:FAD-dependent oxidoreductase [Saprospiraceae bacterium]
MPPAIWHSLKLLESFRDSDNTRRFIFQTESPEPINYVPGQFLTCDLPIGEKRLQRWRSYSIANRCDETQQIEFCISYKKDGPASEFFFHKIQKGDIIKAKGPEGTFVLPQMSGMQLVMICTGTGLAPYRAMLQEILQSGHSFSSIHLIFGCRKSDDILFRHEWSQWASGIPNFFATICLSRENEFSPKDFKGIRFMNSYVHAAYLESLASNTLDRDKALFMLCGWQEMIDEAIAKLYLEQKIPREQIRFELFG